MALVICPECGRENVSDTALSCPDCGYAIKEHYDKIKAEEQRLEAEKALQAKKEAEERHKQETAKERQRETVLRLEKQIEKASKQIRNSLISLLIAIPLTILFWCLSTDGSLGMLIVICAVIDFISIVFLFSGIQEKDTAISDLETAKRDLQEYERNVDARISAIIAQGQAQAAKDAAKHPVCPLCGSRNTNRISTINRTASVATLGLASSKIGKQYECKNCKHKW